MFDDEDDDYVRVSDDLDDFDYYCSFIKALEDEYVSKSEIVQELMNECDLEQEDAVKVLKRYLREKAEMDSDDDEDDDTVEDDDYSDGNSER